MTAIQPALAGSLEKPGSNESFLRRLASIVAQIYTTFSQISQHDRIEITRLECNFKHHSFDTADLMRSRGNLAFGSACFSMIVFGASFGLSNANDQKFVQLVSEKIPGILNMFDSRRESAIKIQDAVAQLEYAQVQDKNSKTQTDANVKEQFASVLQAEIQRLRSASAGTN